METELQEKITKLNVGYTDVILIQYGLGAGKIIISDCDTDINTSYYWGRMGGTGLIQDFILSMNEYYFIKKLGYTNKDEINIKATMINVRRSIKEDLGFKFWMDIEFNKELRDELNMIQEICYDQRHFVDLMNSLGDTLDPRYRITKYKDEIQNMLSGLTTEPWNYIVPEENSKNIWLKKFLPKLKTKLLEQAS